MVAVDTQSPFLLSGPSAWPNAFGSATVANTVPCPGSSKLWVFNSGAQESLGCLLAFIPEPRGHIQVKLQSWALSGASLTSRPERSDVTIVRQDASIRAMFRWGAGVGHSRSGTPRWLWVLPSTF